MHGTLEKHPTRSLYRVSLVLNLLGTKLVTHEVRSDLKLAIREAFLELERQLKKYKALLRGKDQWKRLARLEEIRRNTSPLLRKFPALNEYYERLAVIVQHPDVSAEDKEKYEAVRKAVLKLRHPELNL